MTKASQAQYDLAREAAKLSALSSEDLLEKYEYLTGEDLGRKPSVFEKAKFEYSPLGMSLSEASVKSAAGSKSDFNYDKNHAFYRFYKWYDEFVETSLDLRIIRRNNLINVLLVIKLLKKKKKKRNATYKGAN